MKLLEPWGNIMDAVLKLICIIFILFLFFVVVFLPYDIAKKRGLDKGQQVVICVLCWLTLIVPFLWIVAIIMSVVCKPMEYEYVEEVEEDDDMADLDKLEKLHNLYKGKVITKAEYEKYKKKIMG